MKPYELTALQVAEGVRRGELSAVDVISSLLERIERLEDRINAYITVRREEALKQAEEIDKKVKRGERVGRLCGVGFGIKDIICTEGIPTTCASKILKSYIPPYDATVIHKIKKEDGILLGKTNLDEFAMGSSTEHSIYGATHNPWDLERVPGGSSGGSGAAVAAEMASAALGTDTGGSVRCPASFCSVVGLKPTYGLVSRYGLIAYANSLEQIGTLTRTVEDSALILSVIGGYDSMDSTSVNRPKEDYLKALGGGVEGLRIGVPREFFGEGTHEGVKERVWKAISRLEALGASYNEITLKSLEYALPAYYIIAMSEASSNLARYDGIRYGFRVEDEAQDFDAVISKNRSLGFGEEVKRRILLGTYSLSAGYYNQYYLKALRVRTLIKRDFERAFKASDILVTPTMPILPFKIGEKMEDPLEMYMCDLDTVSINLAGMPAISIPCGFIEGLPVGMQIIGPPFKEELILRVAYTYERETHHSKVKPPLGGG